MILREKHLRDSIDAKYQHHFLRYDSSLASISILCYQLSRLISSKKTLWIHQSSTLRSHGVGPVAVGILRAQDPQRYALCDLMFQK